MAVVDLCSMMKERPIIMEEWNVRPYQDAILKVFREFQHLCERRSLRYFAVGGTAIGAIRHHGFIPWDDDLDVAMPREDYDTFLKIAEGELPRHLKVYRGGESKDSPIFFAKILDVRDGILEKLSAESRLDITTPPFIDVFVLDGVPDNVNEMKGWWRARRRLRMCQIFRHPESTGVSDGIGGRMRKILAAVAGAFLSPFYPATKSNADMMLLLDACARQWPYEKSLMITEPAFFRFKFSRVFHKCVFEPARMVPFEDGTICVPAKVEEYLTQLFGNYMELPPKEHRIPEHIMKRAFAHA